MNATAAPTPTVPATDAELLRQFVEHKDQSAFAALVARHGPMVLAVCRAKLGRTPDADDATQAVFLTLAQRADTLLDHPTLAGWLYRVARHVSLRAATMARRRQHHEREAAAMKSTSTPRSDDLPLDMLHDALSRLPEKYRVPLILHHMEGMTQDQTAAALKLKVGTLSARLTRARDLLRTRLVGKGVAVSLATAAPHVLADSATAALPALLSQTITTSAAAVAAGGLHAGVAAGHVISLSKGALNMLYFAKLKTAALAVLAVLFVTTTGAYIATNAAQPNPAAAAPAAAQPARGKLAIKLAELDVQAAKARLDYERNRVQRLDAAFRAATVSAEERERGQLELKLSEIGLMVAEVKLQAAANPDAN